MNTSQKTEMNIAMLRPGFQNWIMIPAALSSSANVMAPGIVSIYQKCIYLNNVGSSGSTDMRTSISNPWQMTTTDPRID